MPNRWIDFVKEYAAKNNISYGCAISKPECKELYKKKYGDRKKITQKKEKEMMGIEDIDVKQSPKIKKPSDEEIIKAINLPLTKMTVKKIILDGIPYYKNTNDGRLFDFEDRTLVGLYKNDKEYITNIDDYIEEEEEKPKEKPFPSYKEMVGLTKKSLSKASKNPSIKKLLKRLKDDGF